MIPRTGQNSNGKIITYKLPEYEGSPQLKILSQRMCIALITSILPLDWMKRHASLPADLDTQDKLDAWVDDLRKRLMDDFQFCAEMINCIENDEDVKNALVQLMNERLNIPSGEVFTNEKANENLASDTNPGCDYDILFAQCRAVVNYTHLAILDVLQKVEVTTNLVELVKGLWDSVPGLGLIDDAAGGNGVVQLFNYYQEAVLESYEAQYTETPLGTFDELSYGLFCYCRNDCTITVNKIVGFYQDRLEQYIAAPSLSGLVNFLETIAGIDQDTTFVVDMAHFVAWGLVKVASLFFGAFGYDNSTLDVILRFVADEPSNDWETLAIEFDECPEEVLLTPIIKIISDFYPVPFGYDLMPVEGEPGFWIVNLSTNAPNDYIVTLEEEGGQPFSISNRSFPDGLISANYNAVIDGIDTALFFSSPQHDNMTEVSLNMFGGVENPRFKFKFFRPA